MSWIYIQGLEAMLRLENDDRQITVIEKNRLKGVWIFTVGMIK